VSKSWSLSSIGALASSAWRASSVAVVTIGAGTLAAVDRAIASSGIGKETIGVRQLVGGTHAATWLVAMDGPVTEAVLREFPAGDESVPWEAEVLRALDGLEGLVPRLLAAGADDPVPWLLLSRLPGTADITSVPPETIANQLGMTLARIHRPRGEQLASLRRVLEMDGGRLESLTGPAASVVKEHWQRVIEEPLVLTHSDFWSGNVVWDAERVSGVVDWNGGSLGPRGYDVGWCRLDLYLLFDEAIADLFLHAYEAAVGETLADPALWDLWSVSRSDDYVETWVPNYLDLGRADLTAANLRTRHREWTDISLERARP
jgi:aminoglycoside phosphotransferase (APT) family kinase protein